MLANAAIGVQLRAVGDDDLRIELLVGQLGEESVAKFLGSQRDGVSLRVGLGDHLPLALLVTAVDQDQVVGHHVVQPNQVLEVLLGKAQARLFQLQVGLEDGNIIVADRFVLVGHAELTPGFRGHVVRNIPGEQMRHELDDLVLDRVENLLAMESFLDRLLVGNLLLEDFLGPTGHLDAPVGHPQQLDSRLLQRNDRGFQHANVEGGQVRLFLGHALGDKSFQQRCKNPDKRYEQDRVGYVEQCMGQGNGAGHVMRHRRAFGADFRAHQP